MIRKSKIFNNRFTIINFVYVLNLALITCYASFCQSNSQLIQELKKQIFTDKDSIDVNVITNDKSIYTYKVPLPNINFQTLEGLAVKIQGRSGDTLYRDLTRIILDHDAKYEREWIFAQRMDKSYVSNVIHESMEIRDKVTELLELTRVSVYLNNSNFSLHDKYIYLKDFHLSGWEIKNKIWIENSILISDRYKKICCGLTHQPIELIEKNKIRFEDEMLIDFEKIITSDFKDVEEKHFYFVQLPPLLAHSDSDKFEKICAKAYHAGKIKGKFESGEFYMYLYLGRRGKTNGIKLLLKDFFRIENLDYTNIGYITATENGRFLLNKAIAKEIKKRKKYDSQAKLIQYYLKAVPKAEASLELKKCIKYFNTQSLEIPEVIQITTETNSKNNKK